MRFPFVAAEHAFLFTLLLVAVAGMLSLVIFTYGFSNQTKQERQEASLYDFKEELFLDTLQVLEKRAQNLEDVSKETSRDIFNPD